MVVIFLILIFFHFVLPPTRDKQRRFEDEEEMPTPESLQWQCLVSKLRNQGGEAGLDEAGRREDS